MENAAGKKVMNNNDDTRTREGIDEENICETAEGSEVGSCCCCKGKEEVKE